MNQNVLLIRVYSDQEIARFNATVLKKLSTPSYSGLTKKAISVWGITSSNRNLEIWKRVKLDDCIIFQLGIESYYIGLLSHKRKSKQIANDLWKRHHVYASSFDLLLFIKNLVFVSDLPETLHIPPTENTTDVITLLSEIQTPNNITPKFLKQINSRSDTKISKSSNEFRAIDYAEPPERIRSEISRIIRDTVKSVRLKIKYGFVCQICGYQLKVNSRFYCEVHHVWPLGEGGMDNYDNMIVLCPNHHAEFDICAIGIDPKDGITIIDTNLHVKGKAKFIEGHSLSTSNLKYHYKKITQNKHEFN